MLYSIVKKYQSFFIYAINDDGAVIWRYTIEDTVDVPYLASGTDGTLYFGTRNPKGGGGALYPRLHTIRNMKEWGIPVNSTEHIVISPDGTIFCGGLDAIDQKDGSEKWHLKTDGMPSIGSDGKIYAVINNTLCAIKSDGSLLWNSSTEFGGHIIHSYPVISPKGAMYFTGYSWIISFDMNGNINWKHVFPSTKHYERNDSDINNYLFISNDSYAYRSPAIGPDGTIYLTVDYINSTRNVTKTISTTEYHYLYCLNQNGTVKWRIRGNTSFSHPAVGGDGTIFVVQGGALYALYPNGTVKWNSTDLKLRSDPVIGPDGTVYVYSSDTLYAFGDSTSTDVPLTPILALVLITGVSVAVIVLFIKRKDLYKGSMKQEK